jgi:hypothetical protein
MSFTASVQTPNRPDCGKSDFVGMGYILVEMLRVAEKERIINSTFFPFLVIII